MMQAESSSGAPAPATRRRVPAGEWRRPGLHYGAWYAMWECEEVYRSLTPSAQSVYRYLWAITGGHHRVGVPGSRGSEQLGIWPRTWRRAIVDIEAAGLLDVEQGGGAHAACNHYVARAVGRLTHHQRGEEPLLRRDVEGERYAEPDPRPSEELLQPAAGYGDDSGPSSIEDLPRALVEGLVQVHADEQRLDPAEVRSMLRSETVGSVLQLAAMYGLEVPVVRTAPVATDAVRELGRRIVADYIERYGLRRPPHPRELAQARALVLHSGVRAWDLYLAAVRRMEHLRRAWRVTGPPQHFGFLWMHLVRLRAVATPEPERPPARGLEPPGSSTGEA